MFPAMIKSVIGRVPDESPGESSTAIGVSRWPENCSRDSSERTSARASKDLLYVDHYRRRSGNASPLSRTTSTNFRKSPLHRSGDRLSALAFIVPPARKSLLSDKAWNPESFRENHLFELLGDP